MHRYGFVLLLVAFDAAAQSVPSDLTRLSPEGATPSWTVFCGQSRKYAYDGSIAVSDQVHNENGAAVCYNNAYALYPVARAIERAEIRGWILWVYLPGSRPNGELDNGFSDDEFSMDVLLDVGWATYASGGTCPVNAPETAAQPCALNEVHAIGDSITPHNLIRDGERTQNSTVPCTPPCITILGSTLCFPPVDCSAISSGPNFGANHYAGNDTRSWAILDEGNHEKWGGTGAVAVHVEIDGWGPSRGCDIGDVPDLGALTPAGACQHFGPWVCDIECYQPLLYTYDYGAHAPPGWTFRTPWSGNPNLWVYWPFPLSSYSPSNPTTPGAVPFAPGQYVRLVGTLWKDESHAPSTLFASPGWGLQQHAQSCWVGGADYTNFGGKLEMHSVDYISLPPAPALKDLHTLAGYEICSKAGDWNTITHTFSMGPRPYPNSRANVVEHVEGTFTNWSSLRPSADSPRYSFDGNGNVTVHVTAVDASPPAKFTGVYDAFWTCTPSSCAGTCGGDDGCGTPCPTTCQAGYLCNPALQCVLPCGPSNCSSGCCDSYSTCQPGTNQRACGSGGNACRSCGGKWSPLECIAQMCQ